MATRVIQWATGSVGTLSLKLIIENPNLELVGVLVYGETKEGLDAGELAGTAPTGVVTTRDRDAIIAMDADVVIHTPLAPSMEEMDADVLALLASGKNVISTAGYFAPSVRGPELVARIQEACEKGGGTSLHGGGIEPGFMFDRVAPMMTGMCSSIEHIRLFETIDASKHPAAQMILEALAIGKPLDTINEASPFFQYFKAMFTEVATAFGEALSIQWDELEASVEVAAATQAMEIAVGSVEAGSIAGNRYSIKGTHQGKHLLTIEVHWFVERGIAGWPMPAERYQWGVEIEGAPSCRTVMDVTPTLKHGDTGEYAFDPGYTGCAASAIHAIPEVIAAPAGHFRPPVFAPWTPQKG